MNYIDHNFDWLEEKLAELEGKYILFDFPGQVELYTHEASVFNILQKLQKLNYKVPRPIYICFTYQLMCWAYKASYCVSCVTSCRSCTSWTRTTAPTAPSSSRSCC